MRFALSLSEGLVLVTDNETMEKLVKSVIIKEGLRQKIIGELQGSSRRARQTAAHVIGGVAKQKPEVLVPYADDLVDALNRPEAQTRWECLDALTEIVAVDSRACDKAIPGAEASLFDESNSMVRLSAMRFLCRLGATTENRSEKTWPLIDEGIQCYHGDLGFQEMLNAVIGFSEGKLSDQVKQELKERMAFDAKNGKGALKARANQIIENLSK